MAEAKGRPVISRARWLFMQVSRRLWFRASLISLLAIVAALAGLVLAPFIPRDLPSLVGADAVESILHIIASSMLAVTTFSLSTMVAAYSAASSGVTPRAAKLLMADPASQRMLGVFIGSFLYSLVGIVALSTGVFGKEGRIVLFLTTIIVIVMIVVTFLGWIDHITRLGRVGETTESVERAATNAFQARLAAPWLGGVPIDPLRAGRAPGARPVLPDSVGYVQHVDMAALEGCAQEHDVEIEVVALPGTFVDPARALAWLPLQLDSAEAKTVATAFVVGRERSFDQDPRFGLSVLAEIASRALSPAVNDPGTAIDVIGRAVRILALAATHRDAHVDPQFPRVRVPSIRTEELFDDVFTPIARDGAGLFEVHVRLLKGLQSLARLGASGHAASSLRHARMALARAEAALVLEEEKEVLRVLVAELEAGA